ncbi:MAG: glycosyltransferase family 2 protein [Cellulomonadaceae bacterium]|jgi:glycosyltransferase involved in cell wall biosynthesis|nr:glycosyltransferase family 2 protein [Cellulomonadaceae bacterium]
MSVTNPHSIKTLSVVVPCYNEQESLPIFVDEFLKRVTLPDVKIECIFVDDGSKDDTLAVLRDLQSQHPDLVRLISFSRNFGKESALYAGLQAATGDAVAVMDADLQDPPELLPEMVRLITEEDYDCVGTRRVDRKGEPPIRSFFARMFYRLINSISDTEMVDGARDYRLMTRQMVDSILELSEYNRFSKGLFSWVGYKTHYMEFDNVERVAGETHWSFWNLFSYSITGIINFSTFPLKIATGAGMVAFAVAVVMGIIIFIRTLAFGDAVAGWTSQVLIILFLGSFQLLSLGIIGEYIGKIFLETKRRPVYVVREETP